MRFTLVFFLVLGYSAMIVAAEEKDAEISAEAAPAPEAKGPGKKPVVEKKPAPAEKKEEVKVEAVEETDGKKKEKKVEVKKVEKEEPLATGEPVEVVASTTEKPKEEEGEGIISNVVNTVVKVTKSIANKVKNFFGIGEKETAESQSTVVVETATSAAPAEKAVEIPVAATEAPKEE